MSIMKGGRMNAEVDDWKETNEYKRTYVPNAFGATVQRSESAGHARAHSTPCLLYTSPSPRDATLSRMPSSA